MKFLLASALLGAVVMCASAQRMPPMPPMPPGMPQLPPVYMQDMTLCNIDSQGRPTGKPPGGFPAGMKFTKRADGHYEMSTTDKNIKIPPKNWDGNPWTMGFPIPNPSTPQFNMLFCNGMLTMQSYMQQMQG